LIRTVDELGTRIAELERWQTLYSATVFTRQAELDALNNRRDTLVGVLVNP
jgi:hypothetical protein